MVRCVKAKKIFNRLIAQKLAEIEAEKIHKQKPHAGHTSANPSPVNAVGKNKKFTFRNRPFRFRSPSAPYHSRLKVKQAASCLFTSPKYIVEALTPKKKRKNDTFDF